METFGHVFWSRFFMCFWKALFSALGRPLGTQGVQEAPKWSQNGVKMVPAGTLREVLEPWYLLYGRHMGGLGQALGGNFFRTGFTDPLWRCLGESFCRFGFILGGHWDPGGVHFGVKMVSIFKVRFLVILESKLAGAGGRGWAPGALESAELDAELKTKSNHARLPLKGGRRILRLRPCRRPLCQQAADK